MSEEEKKEKIKKEEKKKKEKDKDNDEKEERKGKKKDKKDKKNKGNKDEEGGNVKSDSEEVTIKEDGKKEEATLLLDENGNPIMPVIDSTPPKTFVELWFDDPVEGEAAQKAAMELRESIELKALPIRTFLEQAIVPLLLQGLQHMVLERPTNPAEYLAAFLLRNNPLKDQIFIEPSPDLPLPDPPPTVEPPKCQCCQLHCPAVPDFYGVNNSSPRATSSVTR